MSSACVQLIRATRIVAPIFWSLGTLLYQLVVGEPLVPSNGDDDCVNGNGMAALASWSDDVGQKRLTKDSATASPPDDDPPGESQA